MSPSNESIKPFVLSHHNFYPKSMLPELNKTLRQQCGDIFDERARGVAVGPGKVADVYLIDFRSVAEVIGLNILEWAERTNRQYFGYDLYTPPYVKFFNYTIYDSSKGGKYDFHIDQSDSPYTDIKLTIIFNVSDTEYTGGDLVMTGLGDNVLDPVSLNLPPGGISIFKSYMPHRVTPVTSGIRKTLVLFLEGPAFK